MPLTDPQAILDRNARRRRRMARWLVVSNVVIALLLTLMVWQVLSASHRSYQEQAANVSARLAAIAKLNVESEIGRIDGVIRATASELERLLEAGTGVPDGVLNAVLKSRFDLLSDIEAFRLADEQGNVRWGTALPPGRPVQVADRDYFRLAQASDGATIVAGPVKSRVSGNWVIAFVRPLRLQERFAGILYVSVGVEHFRTMFQRYDLKPLDAVSLRKDDLALVSRLSPGSPAQGLVGDKTVSQELKAHLATNSRQGTFVSRAIDGEVRTTSFRALDEWPFVVYAGVSNERFMTPWRNHAWTVIALAGLVWLLGVLATWLVFRADGQKDRAMRALAEQGQRIRALLRVAADGIHITDGKGRLVEMSDSFAEMLRSTREQLLGRHISTWDARQSEAAINAWLGKIKDGHRQRVDVQHRRDDGELIEVELNMSVTQIAGQLLVFSSGRDVTQIRRLVREQSAMLDSDLVGVVRIADRKITWHNRAVERIFGYGPGELDGQPMRTLYTDDASFEALGREVYAVLATQPQYRSQVRMRRKNGDPVWVDFGAARLSETEIFVMAVDITIMKEAHDALSHAAFHDALTQLPNRALLYDRIEQALAVAAREYRKVAIGYLDLDGFKAVNDHHGHDAGDLLLQQIARRLQDGVRPSDTVARIGGDEFVVLLTSLEDDEWKAVFDRLIAAIEQPVQLSSGKVVTVGATIGVALSAPKDQISAYQLVERADHVMLQGKRGTKGHVIVSPH
jgi:diguanylate cyclase (GGDEF)-like protein/PAS domain S-box-containing protein